MANFEYDPEDPSPDYGLMAYTGNEGEDTYNYMDGYGDAEDAIRIVGIESAYKRLTHYTTGAWAYQAYRDGYAACIDKAVSDTTL